MNKKDQSMKSLAIVVIILLAANLFFNIMSVFNKSNALAMEELKAGGKENFEIMRQIFQSPTYQTQQKSNLLQTLQTFGGENNIKPQNNDEEQKDNTISQKNDKDMIKTFSNIIKDSHLEGNKDARFTIVEYSELFCPFCKRQHNNRTIDQVMQQFDGQVNSTFRNFIVHPGAKKYAEAAECIADIEGEDAYQTFIDKSFELESAINDTSLASIIKEMGRNDKKINKCINDGTFANKVDTQTQEGRSLFSVKGTPGNVILDHKTGRFVLIPGAYPASKFIEEINKLMK